MTLFSLRSPAGGRFRPCSSGVFGVFGVFAAATLSLVAVAACGEGGTGPQYVDDLALTPDTLTLEIGQSGLIEALPLGPRGERYADRAERVEWRLFDDTVLDFEVVEPGVVRVTADTVGSTRLSARLGRGYREARIQVYALLPDRVTIEPSSVELNPSTTSTRVQARLYKNDAPLPPDDYDFFWASGNSQVVLLLPEGDQARLIARQFGTTNVRVAVGGVSASITVRVVP